MSATNLRQERGLGVRNSRQGCRRLMTDSPWPAFLPEAGGQAQTTGLSESLTDGAGRAQPECPDPAITPLDTRCCWPLEGPGAELARGTPVGGAGQELGASGLIRGGEGRERRPRARRRARDRKRASRSRQPFFLGLGQSDATDVALGPMDVRGRRRDRAGWGGCRCTSTYQPAFLTKLLLRRSHGQPCLAFARSGCST